jgi:hypothetical protein
MVQMVESIRLGLEDGTISRERVQDPVKTALYLRGSLHGVIMLCQSEQREVHEVDGEDGLPAESLIRHTMDMLTTSIAN